MTVRTEAEVTRQHKAIALYSGGLDSTLAVVHMQRLGYEVIPVFFETPFFTAEKALSAAKAAGLKLSIIDITTEHLEMMQNPRYGFGKNMNPCIDCHGLMFRKASELMEELGVDFLISGEVLGQRPMSQRMDAMNAVRKISFVRDLIVRPLSQRLLPDTLPVTEGWVLKDEMLDIQGRSRKPQEALAAVYGITKYHNPGGGCLLTEKGFSVRLKDLMEHEPVDPRQVCLLRYGRHFRLNRNTRLIVGKTARDNQAISELLGDETVLKTVNRKGPLGVLISQGDLTADELRLAGGILLHFTDKSLERWEISYGGNFQLDRSIVVDAVPREQIMQFWLKGN